MIGHNRMKGAVAFSCVLLPLLALSCSDKGAGAGALGDGPVTIKIARNMEVLAITENRIVVANPVCNAGVLEAEPDTSFYQLGNGQLIQWSIEDCHAVAWSGSHSSVYGTWALSSGSVPVPGGADEECDEESEDDLSVTSATLTVTQSTLTVEVQAEVCIAEQLEGMSDGSREARGCNEWLQFKNGDTATITILKPPSNFSYAPISLRFSFAGKVCELNSPADLEPTAEVCAEAWARFQEEEGDAEDWNHESFTEDPRVDSLYSAYNSCVHESGFGEAADVQAIRKLMRRHIP